MTFDESYVLSIIDQAPDWALVDYEAFRRYCLPDLRVGYVLEVEEAARRWFDGERGAKDPISSTPIA